VSAVPPRGVVPAAARALAAIGAIAMAALAHGQAPAAADARFEALAGLTEAQMREHGVPGVALGIVHGGTVTIRGFGVTSVENPVPVGPHTVFPIASISKTFAATAAMRLAEMGKLDLRDPVRRHLPDFRVQDEAVSREVTLWHLLTHSSGWEGQVAAPDRGEETLQAFVAGLGDLMQLAPPGAVWSYNNAGLSVFGRVVEVIQGSSINRVIRDLVFEPLGLEHAGTTAGEFITFPFALGHDGRGGRPAVIRPFRPSTSVTSGGVGMCVTDLIAYARFHLAGGETARGERLVTRASAERMREAQLPKAGTGDEMGIGWHLRTAGGVRLAAHGGTLAGHVLLLELVPARGFAIAILTNAISGWRLIQEVERAALRSYLDVAFEPNQSIAHRGLVETLPWAAPLAIQPDFTPYVGTYERPMNGVSVRVEDGRLVVQILPRGGRPEPPMPVAFYGPDRALVVDGPDRGQSIEFVRDAGGQVKWVRIVGRIAVRAPSSA
jgi:CubicO group peptidase (beta-lactamase class C family)